MQQTANEVDMDPYIKTVSLLVTIFGSLVSIGIGYAVWHEYGSVSLAILATSVILLLSIGIELMVRCFDELLKKLDSPQ